jgi:hypothetical protein
MSAGLFAASAGMSLLSAYNKFLAGKTAARDYKIQAEGIELAATQREADRKAQLNDRLAAAIAGQKGTDAALARLSEEEAISSERDAFMSRLDAMAARAKGRSTKRTAKTGGLLDAATGLLGGSIDAGFFN